MNRKRPNLIALIIILLAGTCWAANKVITPDLAKISTGDGWTVFNRETKVIKQDDKERSMESVTAVAQNIDWDDQASMTIEQSGKIICIDPYRVKNEKQADVVLITHAHQDHLSPQDITKVLGEQTVIMAPADCITSLSQKFKRKLVTLQPGAKHQIEDITIEAVPAYNIGKRYHPKSNNWVGYVVTVDGVRIYHAGDTNRIPEMKDITCDIALLPLGQTYTMDSVDEAVQAALDVKARIAIPMHYGTYEGSNGDAIKFKEALEGKCSVMVKERE